MDSFLVSSSDFSDGGVPSAHAGSSLGSMELLVHHCEGLEARFVNSNVNIYTRRTSKD